MNTSSIVDIIRLLVTIDSSSPSSQNNTNSSVNPNNRAIQWLKKIRLIDHLAELFASGKKLNNKVIASVYCNASQAIADLIKITREQLMNLLFESNVAAGLLVGMANSNDGSTFRMDHDGASSSSSDSNKASESRTLDVSTLVKNSILEDIERFFCLFLSLLIILFIINQNKLNK